MYYDYKWFDKWENQSLERVSTDIAGTEKEAWVLSEKLSPGQPNAGILWRSVDKPDIHIGPIPFTPNRDGKNDSLSIRLKLPASYKAKIEIFGFNGRKLYDIPEILSDKYTWNGRTEDGINAPVGPFFVVATFEKNGTKICIRKKGILWR